MTAFPAPSRRRFLTVLGAAGIPLRHFHAGETPLLAGQIGVRHPHAAGKMEAMRNLNDLFRVVGVVEPDSQSRAKASQEKAYEGLPWMTEAELLAVPGLKMVAVETRMEDLEATATRVLAAGKHVHLDKPGWEDHAAFRKMRRMAEQAGLTVQMGYMLRYNPAFALLFKAHREGWLGDILEIDASMGKLASADMRVELGRLQGGGMFELAGHLIDAVLTLLGPPDQVISHNRRTRAPKDSFADNQLAVLAYPKALVTIRCNHADPFGGPRRRFMVTGSKGTFEIAPLESGKVRLSLDHDAGGYAKGIQEIHCPLPGGRYDGDFIDLAKVVQGAKSLAWNADHDIAVHETLCRASGVPVSGG